MDLKPRLSPDGRCTVIERGWKLWIPAGSDRQYRLSQLDDHRGLRRSKYPCRPPLKLSLSARVSSAASPGTWGFGLWNDPYGFSFGPGNRFLTLPALPNAAWFFFSSPASYLSFRDNTPANGLLAQVFSSPRFDPLLLRVGATFPFSRPRSRRLLSRVIRDESVRVDAHAGASGSAVGCDVIQWHDYSLEWRTDGVRFELDGSPVLNTALSPRAPLGIVIWMDNQHAGFDPQGRLSFGLEPNPEPGWLEIRDIQLA
jgi:hypothetical protein